MSRNDYGNGNKLGDWNKLGDDNTLGDWNTLGNWNKLGNWNTLGDWNTLGNWNKLGDDNTLGNWNTLGDWNKLGDDNTLGDWNKLGDGLIYGKRLTAEGVKVVKLMTMSNVDGSGRKIHVYVHTSGIKVVAGCFSGTLDEFCAKADAEGKTYYSVVVRAAAEALRDECIRRGENGGWDDAALKGE